MISELLISTALAEAYDSVKKIIKSSKYKIISSQKSLEESISYHLQFVNNWSNEVTFSDLKDKKNTNRIYIPLKIFLYPKRVRMDIEEKCDIIRIDDLFNSDNNHFILLGHPGAGKTTSMKYICSRLIHDENFYPEFYNFPIVIRFRDLNSESILSKEDFLSSFYSIIFRKLYSILGLNIGFQDDTINYDETKDERKDILQRSIILLLDKLKVLLILDGFDELAKPAFKKTALDDLQTLTFHLTNSSILFTSRTGEFVYKIDNAKELELCPLSKQQIVSFSEKWLDNSYDVSKFINEIDNSPFADTTIRPLTLAHLCAIYERIGKIPDKPKTVYKKIVNLLIEEWDEQRLIERSSKYSNFEPDRKFEFLCNLAYILTSNMIRTSFSADDLLKSYRKICGNFDLPQKEAQKVVEELETHTGLLVKSGYRSFEFSHKSIQEYLSAEYIVKLPTIPTDFSLISKLPNEFAIAVSISSNPSYYLTELVLKRIAEADYHKYFYMGFISRLIQERPDFNHHPNVVISLVTLYSKYLRALSMINDNQFSLFLEDSLYREIEELINLLTKRNTTKILNSFYSITGRTETTNKIKLYELKKKKDSDEYKLPDYVTIRQDFYVN